mgnify:CR=1 FL=1
MATYSFDSIRNRFSREFTNNKTVNKIVDAGMDTAEFVGKHADTILLGAACLMLGDLTEATETLTNIEFIELTQDHPELF